MIGGEPVTREELLAAPLRWPRPSLLRAPLKLHPRTAEAAERLGIVDRGTLIEHVPVTHEFRAARRLKDLAPGEEGTVEVELLSIRLRPTRRRNLRIVEATVADDSGRGKAVWFNQHWLVKQLEPGVHLRIFGKYKSGALQVREFAQIAASGSDPHAQIDDSGVVSVYPGTEGLKSPRIRELVEGVRGIELEVPEPLPGRLRAAERLPSRPDALAEMHFPRRIEHARSARERLAFEDLLLQQLALGLRRANRLAGKRAIALDQPNKLVERWRSGLPFELTDDQTAAAAQIGSDLRADVPMQRLLMGEVGSGKTVVALTAMLQAADCGAQAALMAPTETLAEQHLATLDGMLAQAGLAEVPIALLTGSTPAARRKQLLAQLATGELPLIVGTHALIEPPVEFRQLALAVIDEQHRFGVRQRAALDAKSPEGLLPHVLHMTATPIPRTLALVGFGDLDRTQIKQLPHGRRPVKTRVIPDDGRAEAYEAVREQLREGRQAYVVCALVAESEVLEARAATVEAERLAAGEFVDFRVGLIHGQLSSAEKAAVMQRLADGEIDVLVATTVIEVGIDVPNASVILIEDAERYGISQLHQLRGRVGRGAHESLCVLLGSPSSRRLRALAAEVDGFKLAQLDLELRGAGEELGTRQSGLPRFPVAVLPEDNLLLERANVVCDRLLAADPQLKSLENVLLHDAVIARHGAEVDPIPA